MSAPKTIIKHGNCPKCGRTYDLTDDGLLPEHRVLRGGGSKKVVKCRGENEKPVS